MLEIIFCNILVMSVTSIIIIGLIILIKRVFKNKLTVSWHYYIWVFLLIRLLIPDNPSFPINDKSPFHGIKHIYEMKGSISSKTGMKKFYNLRTDSLEAAESESEQENYIYILETNKVHNTSLTKYQTSLIYIDEHKLTAINILSLIWVIGVICLTLYMLLVGIIFRTKIKKSSTNTIRDDVVDILNECSQLLKIKRNIKIINQTHVKVPALYGIIKPKLLIDESIVDCINKNELRYIILHELCHYKRKDVLMNRFQLLLCIIHWFNPFIWYALNKIREDMEFVCDNMVLKYIKKEERKDYAETLIKVLELFSAGYRVKDLAAVAGGTDKILERRLRLIY